MTHFTKDTLRKSGQYLMYNSRDDQGQRPRFVARFKHKGPVTMAKFKQELIKNHTVESYFNELEGQSKAPVAILRENNPSWYDSLLSEWKCSFKFAF